MLLVVLGVVVLVIWCAFSLFLIIVAAHFQREALLPALACTCAIPLIVYATYLFAENARIIAMPTSAVDMLGILAVAGGLIGLVLLVPLLSESIGELLREIRK